jgi:hypothetical protein
MSATTVVAAKYLADQAERLFERAARAWVRGNNSGDSLLLERGYRQCDDYRRKAEALLKPLGIEVDYPGLYPSFTVRGFGYHSTLSAVSAALESERAA